MAEYGLQYVFHEIHLATACNNESICPVTFKYLNQTYSPLMNAFWRAPAGYGDTNIPLDEMQKFVRFQVYVNHQHYVSSINGGVEN